MPTTPQPFPLQTIAACFATDGPLSGVIPDYEVREGQVELSQAMARAMLTTQHLISEAATGTGKSFAYLVAIAATGQKALVSTHTKALQQQLAEQEIPRLQRIFPGITAAVLKGRSNYPCLLSMSRVEQGERQQDLFTTKVASEEYTQLLEWLATEGQHGDLDDLPFGLSEELRDKVTVSGQECLGRKCNFFERCYSQHAKSRAQKSDIVIVNHSLLLLDLYLGENAGILPTHPVVVIDEGHALEDVATNTFGAELGSGKWRWLERKVGHLTHDLQARLSGTPQGERILDPAAGCQSLASQLTFLVQDWFDRLANDMGDHKVRQLRPLLHEANALMGEQVVTGTRVVQKDIRDVAEFLKSWATEADQLDAERWLKLEAWCERTVGWLETALADPTKDPPEQPLVRYAEQGQGRRGRLEVKVKPVRVADLLEEYLWNERTVIATSATLATGSLSSKTEGPFAYWRARVGVDVASEITIPSPFPFRTSTRLFIPADGLAYDPTRFKFSDREAAAAYRQQLCETIRQLIAMKDGGAFVLCTSIAMTRAVEESFGDQMPCEVFVQGDAPPAELIRRFKAAGDGVLIGTRTFWEGVDLPGRALQLVIIDRLPFGVPDDPLWEARCQDVGQEWFKELALPTTLISLKQAFGRLMRRMTDVGCVAILDGRLRTKSYGAWLVRGLPPSPVIGQLSDVQQFFQGLRER